MNCLLDEKTRNEIAEFEKHLDATGHYIGENLAKYGMHYRPGDYIPVDKRYSATLLYRQAKIGKTMCEKWERKIKSLT